MKPAPITAGYSTFLTEVKGRIQSARLQAGRAVNRELVMLYWDIGRGIVERQKGLGWGDAVVERFATDLRAEFPGMRGFSSRSIWEMKRFYVSCTEPDFLQQAVADFAVAHNKPLGQPVPEILAQAVRELVARVPWGHHANQLSRIADPAARLYYLRATAQCGWSRSVLLNQIKAGTYERAVTEKKTHNFALALPEHFAEQADEMLKSRYNLEFLGIARPMRERELEDRLVSRLQQFILELGYGFCFVGRQYRLALGKKEYFVDLLFYHRFLKALVAFDLHPIRYASTTQRLFLRLRPSESHRRAVLYRIHRRPLQPAQRTQRRERFIDRGASSAPVDLLRGLLEPAGRNPSRKVSQNRMGKTLSQNSHGQLSNGVKIGEFAPEHAGKLDFYLNLLNDKERGPDDNPSIGIILCAEKDDVEVEFALKSKGNPIGVAEYVLQEKLPAEFKGKLPTAKQLADMVREFLPAPKASAKKTKA